MASKKKSDNGDWGGWVLIIALFALGVWPVALILLFSKLFAPDKKQSAAPPLQEESGNPAAASARTPNRAERAARRMVKSPPAKATTVWALKIIGIILAVAGAAGAYDPVDMMIWLGHVDSWYVRELLRALAIAAGGVGMFCAGISMERAMKRYQKYLAVMGDREAIPVEELVRKLGFSERRVSKDLQKMIDRGYFGGQAYLNIDLGYFFRSSQANANLERQRQQAAAQAAPKEAEEGYSGILRNIRRANDQIADPVLSEKIDRLESITAKIFRTVEEDPRKRSQIDTFLNYYLPTTQKLLDSYAMFEATGIEGENLKQAKERIEKTMDSIVEGFEHQLDALYKADVMDVTSDIQVMESMLNRDTASVERDFGLGRQEASGAAAPAGESSGAAAMQQMEEER